MTEADIHNIPRS